MSNISPLPNECKKVAFDGSTIRSLMVIGDDAWKAMVSPAVSSLLSKWSIDDRIRALIELEEQGAQLA